MRFIKISDGKVVETISDKELTKFAQTHVFDALISKGADFFGMYIRIPLHRNQTTYYMFVNDGSDNYTIQRKSRCTDFTGKWYFSLCNYKD